MTGTNTASQVLRDLYEIDADLTELYGELDDNFLAVTESGERQILKIMHVGCDPQRVDLQCGAMAHLADTAAELNLPRVIPATNGDPYTEIDDGGVKPPRQWPFQEIYYEPHYGIGCCNCCSRSHSCFGFVHCRGQNGLSITNACGERAG